LLDKIGQKFVPFEKSSSIINLNPEITLVPLITGNTIFYRPESLKMNNYELTNFCANFYSPNMLISPFWNLNQPIPNNPQFAAITLKINTPNILLPTLKSYLQIFKLIFKLKMFETKCFNQVLIYLSTPNTFKAAYQFWAFVFQSIFKQKIKLIILENIEPFITNHNQEIL
jgi:hypothetical protein